MDSANVPHNNPKIKGDVHLEHITAHESNIHPAQGKFLRHPTVHPNALHTINAGALELVLPDGLFCSLSV